MLNDSSDVNVDALPPSGQPSHGPELPKNGQDEKTKPKDKPEDKDNEPSIYRMPQTTSLIPRTRHLPDEHVQYRIMHALWLQHPASFAN